MSIGAMDSKKGVDPMAAAAKGLGDAPKAPGGSKKKDMLAGAEGFEAQERKLAPPEAKEAPKSGTMA